MKKNPENKEPTYTPMVEQYLQMKKSYGDIILFFRLGDFYEMFLEDAELCSKELQLFLTKKAAGNGTFIPMCGIPHHAYLSYAQKLIDRGYKVAICEQVEDPKLTKKLVKRDVVQIITPGANLDLNSSEHNYIASLSLDVRQAFLCYGDISTGEMKMLSLENSREQILEKILSLEIKELVLATNTDASLIMYLKENSTVCISYSNDSSYSIELEPLFVNLNDPRQIDAALRLFHYMTDVEKRELSYFKPVLNLMEKKSMKIDYSAQSNMELVKSLDGKTFGTLFWLLNKTETPMGTRYLKEQILNPSASLTEVERRLDLTELFVNHFLDRETLRDDLKGIFDMERLICRMGYENCNGHDLLQLKKSLQAIPKIRGDLERLCPLSSALQDLYLRLGDYTDLVNLLESAISENCPITITEGEIFKRGYNADLDELISLTTDAKEWISNLEIQEKERTGIHNLRVGYNSVFGYYIEVSASQVPLVKPEFGYIRKQTIKTGERYITQELKEKEDKILRAKELRTSLEYRLFKELRKKLSSYTEKIQASSDAISELDYFLCLAYVASENNYIRPKFSLTNEISITKARHPIFEKASPDVLFVANDYSMKADTDVLIITGPNMGGKSTYMKEFGLLVIMAQIGSFVPAESCEIPLFDALFTSKLL